MAAAARPAIRVHDAELSTDQDHLRDYAEALAWLVAIVALAASAWLMTTPSEGADFTQPAPPATSTADGQFVSTPGGEGYQPQLDGADSVAVFHPEVDAAASATPTFGAPFG